MEDGTFHDAPTRFGEPCRSGMKKAFQVVRLAQAAVRRHVTLRDVNDVNGTASDVALVTESSAAHPIDAKQSFRSTSNKCPGFHSDACSKLVGWAPSHPVKGKRA